MAAETQVGSGAFCLLFAVATACGNDSANWLPVASSFGEGCDQYAAAFCEWTFQCGNVDMALAYGNYDNCRSTQSASCAKLASLPGQGWAPADYSACANTFQTLGCEIPLDGSKIGDCRDKPGSLGLGEACVVSSQCQSLYCSNAGSSGAGCGVCAARAAEGDPCATTAMCDADQLCVPSSKDGSIDICVVRQPLGASCDANQPCESMSSCVSGVCRRYAAEGETCGTSDSARPCDPYRGTACNLVTRQCETKPLAQAGEACGDANGVPKICVFGTTCIGRDDSTEALCVRNATPGSACSLVVGPACQPPDVCRDGLCAEPNDSICR